MRGDTRVDTIEKKYKVDIGMRGDAHQPLGAAEFERLRVAAPAETGTDTTMF
jgi:hypothetical protein